MSSEMALQNELCFSEHLFDLNVYLTLKVGIKHLRAFFQRYLCKKSRLHCWISFNVMKYNESTNSHDRHQGVKVSTF